MPEYALFEYLQRIWTGYFKRVLAPTEHQYWNATQADYLCTLMPIALNTIEQVIRRERDRQSPFAKTLAQHQCGVRKKIDY